MDKTIKLWVQFVVPIEITIPEGASKPTEEEFRRRLTEAAKQRLMQGSYDPRIDIVYDVVSEDKSGESKVPGLHDGQSEIRNDVGTVGGKDSDGDKGVQGNEPGPVERNNSSGTSEIGDAGEDRKEDEGRVHKDETV
jgi:hypothetical protein